jgi:hypothetical protein
MSERRQILTALLTPQFPLDEIAGQLASLPWDSEELVELRFEHVVAVLERFVAGQLRNEDVHRWADLIEARDDIGLDRRHEAALREVIFRLASPELEGPLDNATARSLIASLRR